MGIGIQVIRFSDFQPNPTYDSVVKGVERFKGNHCDSIIAVGGGSAMDVAKCVKLYFNMDPSRSYLEQTIVPNDVKLITVPTTAGSGSEATRYAVIYREGVKQSITDDSIIPSVVLLDASLLKTLPDYQRKSAMLDAFCHAVESFWSINSTEESREYSRKAIKGILANKEQYLKNNDNANAAMLMAAHEAGKAINIAQTTAGHAMCYKLTTLYGIAHGHAAALCVRELWPYMLKKVDCNIQNTFEDLAEAMQCADAKSATRKFAEFFDSLGLSKPEPNEGDYNILCTSVNPERLRNNPIKLDYNAIDDLYHKILKKG